jgi:hypothetical protein
MSPRPYRRDSEDDGGERKGWIDKNKVNSAASEGAIEFDNFRRELIEEGQPVSGDIRAAWVGKIQELADRICPNDEVRVRKPGLATRLFSAEIAVPYAEPNDLDNFVLQLNQIWEEICPPESEWKAYSYPDRKDMYWELAVKTESGYITTSIKLRTATFFVEQKDGASGPERKSFGGSRDRDRGPRKPWQGDGDRPARPEGDRPSRQWEDRGERGGDRPQRPWQDRGGDRPQRPWQDRGGDRPQRPWEDRGGDRPQRPWEDRGGDRPQRPWQDRGGDQPPRPNEGGDRPQRPWEDRGDRPQRPNGGFGGGRPGGFSGGGGKPKKFGSKPDWVKKKKGY